MTQFAYGQLESAYLNVKEAANEPWRGITAWVQGMPYLIIDKNGESFVLEGEDGNTIELERFESWEPATDESSLVAASRLEGSPFTRGVKVGTFTVGNLVYFEKEWQVRVGDTGFTLPLERLVSRYDQARWDKSADLMPAMDYHCPECKSQDVIPDAGMMVCKDCGYSGPEQDFENEQPDYDPTFDDRAWYEDWSGPEDHDGYTTSVKQADFEDEHLSPSVPTGDGGENWNTFEYNLPPHGIHFRTHAAMQAANMQARVHYPPGVTDHHPEGFTSTVPGPTAMDDMMIPMDYTMKHGGSPEDIVVQVETPNDPEQVRQLMDQVGGRRSAKTAEVEEPMNDPTVDTQKGLKCPKCGSHTLRAYSPEGNEATIVCLTCGNEFKRDVHFNPQSSVRQATMPVDPNLHAQILGLTQQIQQAYEQGNTSLAQQLNAQLQQLLNNPNAPINPNQSVMTSGWKVANQWIRKRGDQWCIIQKGTGKELSCHDSEEKANASFRAMEMHKHMGGEFKPGCSCGGNCGCGKGDKKTAVVDNSQLTDTTERFFLESMTFEATGLEEGDRSICPRCNGQLALDPSSQTLKCQNCGYNGGPSGQRNMDYGPLNHTQIQSWYDGADDPYPPGPDQVNLDDYQAEDPQDFDDRNIDFAHCPACDGPGVLLGQLGSRIHYRCRNCGVDFSHNTEGSDHQTPGFTNEAPDQSPGTTYMGSYEEVKEVNQNTLKAFKDSSGNPLEAGRLYVLHHPEYKVPDIVKILNLEDNRIEAAIASDEHGSFPIHITHDDVFTLDPYEDKKTSSWKISRNNISAQEQEDLIKENMEGKARNFDKLNLSNTHYQVKEESTDPYFLLGI